MKNYFVVWFPVLALVLSGISIEVDQPSGTTQIPVTWADLNLTGKLVSSMGFRSITFFLQGNGYIRRFA